MHDNYDFDYDSADGVDFAKSAAAADTEDRRSVMAMTTREKIAAGIKTAADDAAADYPADIIRDDGFLPPAPPGATRRAITSAEVFAARERGWADDATAWMKDAHTLRRLRITTPPILCADGVYRQHDECERG